MTLFASDLPGRPLAGGSRVLAWWLGELRTAYRDAARRLLLLVGNTLTIEAGERVWLLRQGDRFVGRLDWQGGSEPGVRLLREIVAQIRRPSAVIVELPPERVLSRTISLPSPAMRQLDRILSFEIARHFPFSADRMLYRHRIVERPGGSAAARSIEIVAVPRDIVASIAAELAAAGLQANHFALRATVAAPPLFLDREAMGSPEPAAATRRRFAAGFVLLVLIAAASWPIAQQVRLAAIDREIAALRPAADAVLRVRDERQSAAAQADEVARLLSQRPPLIAVLDALTRAVPDGSWLISLGIAGREVVMQGLSPSAATIALALGHDPSFGRVVFRTPVAREAANGLEHFELGVTIKEGSQ